MCRRNTKQKGVMEGDENTQKKTNEKTVNTESDSKNVSAEDEELDSLLESMTNLTFICLNSVLFLTCILHVLCLFPIQCTKPIYP